MSCQKRSTHGWRRWYVTRVYANQPPPSLHLQPELQIILSQITFYIFICKSTSPRSTSTTRITNNSITDGVQAICWVGFLRSLVSQDHHSQFVDCQDSHALNIHNVFLDAGSIISDRGGCRRINWKLIFLWETFTL